VEYRDRLTWFGFGYLAVSLTACGRRIVVFDEAEAADDVVREVTGVLAGLCARLCGRRPALRPRGRVPAF
jgi:putative resolvase